MNQKTYQQIKIIKFAGVTNIIYGIVTTLIYVFNFICNLNSDNPVTELCAKLAKNASFHDAYMTFQLCTVIIGVFAAIYGFKIIKIKNSMIYQVAYFLAGLNSILLMFTGVVLVIAPLSIAAGVKMLNLLKEDVVEEDDEFGGKAKGLEVSNESTATIINSINSGTEIMEETSGVDGVNSDNE